MWFKVCDSLQQHRKALEAGAEALGLWVMAGSWSCAQLTNGFVPDYALPRLASNAEALASRLVQVGLWERAENGYRFHGWDEYQPDADTVREREAVKSEQRREAGKKGGVRSGEARRARSGRSKTEANDEANREANDEANAKRAAKQTTKQTRTPEPDPIGVPKGTPPCSPPAASRRDREPERFAEFYEAFPRHKDRKAAARKFEQVVRRDGVDPDTLIAAAARYADEVRGTEARYVKHPATWLSKGGWLDEPDPQPAAQPPMSTGDQRIAALQARKSEGSAPDSLSPFRALPGGRSA